METLLDRAHLDRAHLAQQTFGDDELAREVLALFAGQCDRLVPGIADPGLDGAARADLAHTLKGSALGVGALRVAALADRIETALRAGDAASLPALEAALALAARETLALL
ncbi:Hpt domain-containing protein [Methylobacterium platani]|uniref:Histidine kinase n=2 Tax=Methylobacterium platani TaxID=427683 RepID=A0A179SH14_9HYPH|nr:Hpt domain-containing protein [Methylobacterium platani]KMO09959.1 histidine kinase [Methylobacterium platani JCM 14648]OAS26692.1 histidine kinase [Methylobacterium platani]